MKVIIKIYCIVAAFSLFGCAKQLDRINENPNSPTEMYPSMVLTRLSISAFGPEFYGFSPYMNSWMIGGIKGGYYNWDRRDFGSEYLQIGMVNEMIKEARRTQEPVYEQLAVFFKAYWIFNISRMYGDVPYSQAGSGKDGVIYASYDFQEDIIFNILEELREANAVLATLNGTIQGDIIFGGDLLKWRKLINTFRLRILINLSYKSTIKGQSVATLFRQIIEDPENNPMMESQNDNAIRIESPANSQNYYLYGNNDFITGYKMQKPIVDFMKERNDRRLTYIASPTPKALEDGLDPADLANYSGCTPVPQADENVPLLNQGLISRLNTRYYQQQVGPPHMMIGYPEQEFILAEAALRGWITDDPQVHYAAGIRASFRYFGFSDEVAGDYLADPLVSLAGSETERLNQIIWQKYINFFMQGGWEPYFELRRTGYPDFTVYIIPNLETIYNNGHLPKRYMYPLAELNYNSEKVKEAISRLEPGDNINTRMWLIEGTDPLRNPAPFPY